MPPLHPSEYSKTLNDVRLKVLAAREAAIQVRVQRQHVIFDISCLLQQLPHAAESLRPCRCQTHAATPFGPPTHTPPHNPRPTRPQTVVQEAKARVREVAKNAAAYRTLVQDLMVQVGAPAGNFECVFAARRQEKEQRESISLVQDLMVQVS